MLIHIRKPVSEGGKFRRVKVHEMVITSKGSWVFVLNNMLKAFNEDLKKWNKHKFGDVVVTKNRLMGRQIHTWCRRRSESLSHEEKKLNSSWKIHKKCPLTTWWTCSQSLCREDQCYTRLQLINYSLLKGSYQFFKENT